MAGESQVIGNARIIVQRRTYGHAKLSMHVWFKASRDKALGLSGIGHVSQLKASRDSRGSRCIELRVVWPAWKVDPKTLAYPILIIWALLMHLVK